MPLKELIAILLVDDDEEDFLLTRDILDEIKHQRYRLDWVDAYPQALAEIQAQKHDVYLVDYRLGAENGLELIRESLEAGCSAPMILLTGQGDFEIDAKAMRIGASDFLVKSTLTANQLERSIRYGIAQARNLQEIRLLNAELEDRVAHRTEALRKAVSDLRQSQQLYHSLARNFPNGSIMVLDRDFAFVFIDGQELLRHDMSSADLLGTRIVDILPEDQRSVVEYYLQRVFEGESLSFEVSFGQQTYSMRGVPLRNADNQVHQVLIVSNNITRQKEVDAEMRNALKKEKELNELKSRFISMASHEFRTPLSTVLSSVSLISRYPREEDQPKRERHIERIKSAVRNLTAILEDFLSLSKLEEGKINIKPVPFDAKALCEEVIEEMQVVVKPGQTIHFSSAGDHSAYLDKHMFRNILINLLSNAIKYSSEGKEIRISYEGGEHYVVLRVEDQGIGIPEAEQVHLFERFYRANNATNIQGTGLGLNIVQKYASLMGGKVEFESVLGKGTVFWVTFERKVPVLEAEPAEDVP
ncbi:MAG: response regulator [Bacteroidetes bacterium]|nr:MAG: response regulator [Bacteroidota bacterium]